MKMMLRPSTAILATKEWPGQKPEIRTLKGTDPYQNAGRGRQTNQGST
jgi:hypothetical protein